MAQCAKKFRLEKLEKLEGILPPLYISNKFHEQPMERGDLVKSRAENIVTQERTSVVIRYTPIVILNFYKPGRMGFGRDCIDVPIGKYTIPLFLSDFNEIRATECGVSYLYGRNGFTEFFTDVFKRMNWKNVFLLRIGDHTVAFGGGQCGVVSKSEQYAFGERNVFMPCKFTDEIKLVRGFVELGIIEPF